MVGGSAGALEPLKRVVADLPANLPVAILVTLHHNPKAASTLAPLLNRIGGLPVVVPNPGDPLLPGYIYVASRGRRLDVTDGHFGDSDAPVSDGGKPAIDDLFRSAAAAYGPRVIGIILSGGLDDGVSGLAAIHRAGGAAIVQRPDEAIVGSMPRNAIERVPAADVARADAIGGLITEMAGRPAKDGADDRDGDGHVNSALWAGIHSLEGQAGDAAIMANRAA